MKKIISVLIILAMTMALFAGCSKGETGDDSGKVVTGTDTNDKGGNTDQGGDNTKNSDSNKGDAKNDGKNDSIPGNANAGGKDNQQKQPSNNSGGWNGQIPDNFDWSQWDGTIPEGFDWSQWDGTIPEGFDWSQWSGDGSDDWDYNSWGGNTGNSGDTEDLPEGTRRDTNATDIQIPLAGVSTANDITDVSLSFREDGTFVFGQKSTLYSNDLTLTIAAPDGVKVYYTYDCRTPDENSTLYTEPILMKAHGGSFPDAYTFRAIAVYPDGTKSCVAARTYLISSRLEGRFTTLIFSVTGDPDELVNAPNGIFAGKNYEQRGRESEREVYVEAWRPDGTNLISQFAGVRIYGGYSRQASIKSMKLFSRKSYDPDHKNFKFSEFGTLKLDGSDEIIKKYDKLVLRNCGNDNMFGFIRDELSQTLCKIAGFECYEAVLPAVTYLNGEYFNFYWLHENYCDKYFKEKFGDAEGEFIILEGGEQEKLDDEDPLTQKYVDIYNAKYNEFIKMDMTKDVNYQQLRKFMDVESYLDFFAWNIALNNWDWPNNNYKVYRYVEADAATLAADGAVKTPDDVHYDGRWRFLVHDMDYSYGLYGQDKTQANYNTLKVVMNKNDVRYAPLFTLLMERKDCRDYFRAKTMEYLEGALSEQTIVGAYNALHASRKDELHYYYKYIEQRNRRGDPDMWVREGNYAGNEDQILRFAATRGDYVIKYMDQLLPAIE